MIVDALVEGTLDEATAIGLIAHCGHRFGTAYGKRGYAYLRTKAASFDVLARYGTPILVLVDFVDTGFPCPSQVPSGSVPQRGHKLLVRAVVGELESWLLAGVEGMARFLRISPDRVPPHPEQLTGPKRSLVDLARRSRLAACREAIVPRAGVSSVVGAGYAAAIQEFIARYWSVGAALERAPSLARCVTRLCEL